MRIVLSSKVHITRIQCCFTFNINACWSSNSKPWF